MTADWNTVVDLKNDLNIVHVDFFDNTGAQQKNVFLVQSISTKCVGGWVFELENV